MRKAADKSQWRDILRNACPVLLKTVKVSKNTERLSVRICHSQEEPKEAVKGNVTWTASV